jgi:hypothetical protein
VDFRLPAAAVHAAAHEFYVIARYVDESYVSCCVEKVCFLSYINFFPLEMIISVSYLRLEYFVRVVMILSLFLGEIRGVEVYLHSFFDLCSRWRCVDSFTPRPLYPQA